MTNIVIVGLKNNNLGDSIILETSKYIVSKILPNANITIMNLFPPQEIMKKHKITPKKNYFIQICTFLRWLYHSNQIDVNEYYENSLANADIVVFAGGGIIKHTKENFWNAIYTIIKRCEIKNIPVYFNAVGVEGYNKFNFYSQLLKYSLNKPCVKHISTRDDIESLNKYVKEQKKISLVGDPALYTSDLYPRKIKPKKSIIGIGLIRGRIFVDYGVKIKEKEIIETYIGIIKELEKKGYSWKLFCNGIENDYKIGLKILEKLNIPISDKVIVPRPKTTQELIDTINSFTAIIAGRLHANIVATSYNIPSVALVWNNKLTIFGKLIGNPNRFIEPKQFKNSSFIVEQLEEAIHNGYNQNKLKELKLATLKKLEKFLITIKK